MKANFIKSIYCHQTNDNIRDYTVIMSISCISTIEANKYFSGDKCNTTIEDDIFYILYKFVKTVYMYNNLFQESSIDDIKNIYNVFIHLPANSKIEFLCKNSLSLIRVVK